MTVVWCAKLMAHCRGCTSRRIKARVSRCRILHEALRTAIPVTDDISAVTGGIAGHCKVVNNNIGPHVLNVEDMQVPTVYSLLEEIDGRARR